MCGCPRLALHRVDTKHSHTTHVSLTIHYPHHPFYGQTVTVVRRSVSFGPHQVQVALSSGYQLVIPEWMLDEERCQGMEIVAHPTVALSALMALRSLLDAQPPLFSFNSGRVVSEASSLGGAHESTTPGNLSVGDPQHAEASGGSADTVPGVTQPLAACSRKRNDRGGKR
jgi:hypothetical protein